MRYNHCAVGLFRNDLLGVKSSTKLSPDVNWGFFYDRVTVGFSIIKLMLRKFFVVLIVSMLPLIELRGAIPIAAGMDLPEIPALLTAMIGNLIPMPFIFLFAQDLLKRGTTSKVEWLRKFCEFCASKGEKGGEKLQNKAHRGIYVALLLFVGIPIPGTGAWTGTLAASFLGLEFKKTMTAVVGGVLMAGTIMLAISFGLFGLIS